LHVVAANDRVLDPPPTPVSDTGETDSEPDSERAEETNARKEFGLLRHRLRHHMSSATRAHLQGLFTEQLLEETVSVDTSHGPISFVILGKTSARRAATLLTKQPATIAWIDSFAADSVFWDIGANVGVFGLYAARQRGVRVLAFEPSADNYTVLCRNIEINAFEDQVIPYCVALAGGTKLGVLNSPSREMGASLHQFGKRGEASRYWNGGNTTSAQGVVGFSIDDFIGQFRPPFPTRLKIDVDGLEWPILQGARNTLCDRRLKSVMAELPLSDEGERNRAIRWLSDAGLDLLSVGEAQESGGERAANHFFSRKNV
jgi:FkbM family methyltransferase